MIDVFVVLSVFPRNTPIDRSAPDALPPGLIWTLIVAAAVIATLALVIVQLMARDRRRHGPAVRGLCRGLRVGPHQYRLLTGMARGLGAHPGSLLVSAGCFDVAAERFVRRHGQKRRVEALRKLLFGN